MALAALISAASHAALAEALRPEYRAPTEAEIAANPALKDQMILDVTPTSGYGLDNVDKLKATLGTEKARADKAETSLAGFSGLKPEDVKVKLTKLEELEKIDPNSEADKLATAKFETLRGQLIEAHKAELAPLKERESLLLGELDKEKRLAAATKAIVDAGGNPDVLLPHVLGQTKFVEKDGKFSVVVVDGDGNPRIGDASGGSMTLEQLVGEFKAKDAFAPLFSASGNSGGGGGGGGGKVPAATGTKKSDLDLNAKAEFIEAHGSEAYLALPA